MEYAVIQTSGHQHIVSTGDTITLDRYNAAEGDEITFDQVVLFVKGDTIEIGKPTLKNVYVTGKVLSHVLGEKKIGIRRRAGSYQRKFGHRQPQTRVQISEIKQVK